MLTGYAQLTATAETCIGYCDGDMFVPFSGVVDGRVIRQPRGDHGFGWDAIFVPDGSDKTFAEMTLQERESVSIRREAALKLKTFLDV